MANAKAARAKATEVRKAVALACLETGASLAATAREVGVTRRAIYAWTKTDPEFAEAYAEALDRGLEAIEDELHTRVFDGVPEALAYQGVLTGAVVAKKSDTLLMFYLKSRDPERYCDTARKAALDRKALQLALDVGDEKPSNAALAALEQMMRDKAAGAKARKFDA